jgi:L-alanine-DL-glutamate epimerase-like enolase superfamily enzyme
VRSDGTIRVPTDPGIGVHIVMDRVEAATEEHVELRAGI